MITFDPVFDSPIEPLDVAKYLKKYWVCCADRMPVFGVLVLISEINKKPKIGSLLINKDTNIVWLDDEGGCCEIGKPQEVFWMPLAEAPEIKND